MHAPRKLHPVRPEQLDPEAVKVIQRLKRHGHQAYLCGGGVRDLLHGKRPKDFDVATSAHPMEVRACFNNCRIIGRRFRLAHVYFRGGKIIEVATFRRTSEYQGEAAHGADIMIRDDNTFGTCEEDAFRRDFTINGLFYDVETGDIIDHVGGLKDLANGLLRTIGDAQIRIREDPVRILRAVKFAARLDLQFHHATWDAIIAHRQEIKKAAPPRVIEEIVRMLKGGSSKRSFELLVETGVIDIVLPGFGDDMQRLEANGSAGEFWRRLDMLDVMIAGGSEFSSAVLLGAMFLPLLQEALAAANEQDTPMDPGLVIEKVLRPYSLESALTRRDKNRIREIVIAQRRLDNGGKGRSSLGKFVHRDFFPEALDLFELRCRTEGRPAENYLRWRSMVRPREQAEHHHAPRPRRHSGRPAWRRAEA
ncbi:MAG: Poly(A) polymerase I [Myxococcota bacterium]|nr:Poly(A) polymerase I [Myxococcota bacterium]